MKTIFALCALTAVVAAALIWNATRLPSHFGASSGAPKAGVADLIDRPADFLRKTVAIEGTVRLRREDLAHEPDFAGAAWDVCVELTPEDEHIE